MSGCCILSSVSSNHSQSVHPSHSPCHPSMDGHATNTTRSPWWVSLYCIHCDTKTIRWAQAEFIIPFIIMQSVFTIFIYLKKLNQDCNFYLHSNFTVNLNNTSGPPRLTPTNIKKQTLWQQRNPHRGLSLFLYALGFPQFNKLTQKKPLPILCLLGYCLSWYLHIHFPKHTR